MLFFSSAFIFALWSFASAAIALDSQLSGSYYIRNADEGVIVGRAKFEDKSLNPKKIVANPDAVAWNITSLGNDIYILENRGAPARGINGAVYADLQSQEFEHWVIQRVKPSGAYTIVSSTDSKGWFLFNSTEDTQVSFRGLIVGPSWPPFYPPSELWYFQPEA